MSINSLLKKEHVEKNHMLFSVLNFRKIQNFQKNNFFYCKTCTIMLAIEFNLYCLR